MPRLYWLPPLVAEVISCSCFPSSHSLPSRAPSFRSRFFSLSPSIALRAAPSSLLFWLAWASRRWKLASSASAARCASSRRALFSLAAARRLLSSASVSLGLLMPPVAERSPRTAVGGRTGWERSVLSPPATVGPAEVVFVGEEGFGGGLGDVEEGSLVCLPRGAC